MSGAVTELQRAIFDALRGHAQFAALTGGGRIFDRAPEGTSYPYVTFGRTSVYDWSTGTESGTDQIVSIHVWSKAKGNREALDIMDAASERLTGDALGMDGHHLVNLRLDFSEVRYNEDLAVHHGLLRFRAVTEPTA